MTATATRPKLPDFEGRDVTRAAIKFSGVGTGMSEGLSVAPIALEAGEEAFFVMRVRCAGVHHDEDKHELLVRIHKLSTIDMAPIDQATAQKALQEYAADVQARKAAIEGQLSLDDEAAAAERERLDEDGSPGEIADAARDRVESGD